MLLAYYSETYSTRRYCQWELTLAVLAAEREGRDAPSRALVISPDGDAERVHPATLRSTLFRKWAPGEETAALVEGVRRHLEAIPGPMADIAPAAPRRWIGANPNRHLSDFVGRLAELWEVHGALAGEAVLLTGQARAPHGGEGTAQLQACGGMGKSMLAEEYARRFAQAYPGGIFWLSATGAADTWRDRLEKQWLSVLTGLDPEMDLLDLLQGLKDLEPEQRLMVMQSRVRARLAALEAEERPYLWVVDDIPHGTSAEALTHWLAPTDGGRTLVTTRDRGLTGVGHALHVRELDEWSAVALLTAYRKPVGAAEEAAAREIAKTLGYYPLAIAVAARLANSYGSFAQFLAEVASPDADARVLAKDLQGELPNGHESNIVATLRLSFQQAETESGPEALDPLRFAACVQPQHPIHVEALIAAYGERARDDVARLDRLSLLDLSKGLATVHPVLCRAIALYSSNKAMADARETALAVYTAAMSDAHDVRAQGALRLIIPHVEALMAVVATADDAELLRCLGLYQLVGRRTREAVSAYRGAARVLSDVRGPNHMATLSTWSNLAEALRAQGRLAEAEDYQREVLAKYRHVYGDEHPETLMSINNLAGTLLMQGAHSEAHDMLVKVLEARKFILGVDHPDTVTSMNNLAGSLCSQGDYAAARTILEEVVAARRRTLGAEHPDTLTSMNNLANTLNDLGRHAEAHELQEEVLSTSSRVFGVDHPDTLRNMNNFAGTFWCRGNREAARVLWEKVLSARRRVLGPEHMDTLTSMSNLAEALRDQGQHAEARAFQEEVLSVRRRVLGARHPDTLTSMNNLAETVSAQGQHAEARALQEEVLSVRGLVFEPEHPDTLTSMNNLAKTLLAQGEHKEARALQEKVCSVRSRVLGAEHPNTLAGMRNLAETFRAQGRHAEARDLQENVLSASRRVLGAEHPDTLICIVNLAATLAIQGQQTCARKLLEEALLVQRRLLGPEHPNSLATAANLVDCLLHLDPERGLRLLLETLETAERAHPNLPVTACLRAFVDQLPAASSPDSSP